MEQPSVVISLKDKFILRLEYKSSRSVIHLFNISNHDVQWKTENFQFKGGRILVSIYLFVIQFMFAHE